jgi:hypothetical protein
MLGWVGYLTCIFGACTGVVVADFKSLMRIKLRPGISAADSYCFAGPGCLDIAFSV